MKKFIKKHKMGIFITVSAIIMVIGLSYAWLQLTFRGSKELSILTSGKLELVLDDTMTDGISVTNSVPVSDDMGLEQKAYTFTLENKGTIDSDYTIYLDDLELTEDQTRMKDSFIKYELVKNGERVNLDLLSTTGEHPNRVLDKDIISAKDKYTYSLKIWIDSNATNEVMDTTFKGQLRIEAMQAKTLGRVSTVIFNKKRIGDKGAIDTSDAEETFITGEEPNNYVWYSGKLWRAVAKDTSDNTVKLVTQWPITAIPYSSENNATFAGSYAEEWLNDTSVDGFLGNLRSPEKFIKMDSLWNATEMQTRDKPAKTTIVRDAVGLLNLYEYSVANTTYLNTTLVSFLLTPYSSTDICYEAYTNVSGSNSALAYGLRPSINLKANVEIVSGEGTIVNPYRLLGDSDSSLIGTLINKRYSGEYVKFGALENDLYRIVSHEFGGTKLTSAEPLKKENTFITKAFNTDKNIYYNADDEKYEIAYFLNHSFLDPIGGFLTESQLSMIDKSNWYMGTVGMGASYKLAKYSNLLDHKLATTTEAFVGLLRLGEQFATQSQPRNLNSDYFLLTNVDSNMRATASSGLLYNLTTASDLKGIRPSVHLKPTIKITGGDGTKNNPFTISE